MARPDIPSAKWVGTPRSFTNGRKAGQPSVIVIHSTDGSEGRTSAEDGAAYDKRRTDGTSTHLFVDEDSIVQEVEFADEAHAARSHGNDVGIQIEVCGRANQTKSQWDDTASRGSIKKLIQACYEIRKKYGRTYYPLVRLSPTQLRAGKHRGFVGHVDVTHAWPEDKGTHTDPGPNFPWATLFAGIQYLENEEDEKLKREYKMLVIEGKLPELQLRDDDRVQGGPWWVSRAQKLLGIKADGDYGQATAAAVKSYMLAAESKTDPNGAKIGLPEWRKLLGI